MKTLKGISRGNLPILSFALLLSESGKGSPLRFQLRLPRSRTTNARLKLRMISTPDKPSAQWLHANHPNEEPAVGVIELRKSFTHIRY